MTKTQKDKVEQALKDGYTFVMMAHSVVNLESVCILRRGKHTLVFNSTGRDEFLPTRNWLPLEPQISL